MKHILSVLVENHAGVLLRIVGLFSRRGFNIHSLAVGVTDDPGVSRVTIVVTGDEATIEQVVKQLNKLIDVIKVKELNKNTCVRRELTLLKIRCNSKNRSEIIQIVNIFRANIIDVSPETLTIELTGTEDKIDAFLGMLEPFGIVEVVRGGMLSLERGNLGIKNQ
ncbi:MAG: acetolactate synthase small subunit [Clostridia bacterium]|nr:acetolactate synthase small subunit [Clostridia bacterium]